MGCAKGNQYREVEVSDVAQKHDSALSAQPVTTVPAGLDEANRPDAEELVVVVPQELLQHLTPASRGHLRARVEQLTTQVLGEGKAIEEGEHVGKGPPAITARQAANKRKSKGKRQKSKGKNF